MAYVSPKEIDRSLGESVIIRLRGCDDVTNIPGDDFTADEMDTIRRLAQMSVDLGGDCKPTIHLGRKDEVKMQRDDGSTYTYEDFVDENFVDENE